MNLVSSLNAPIANYLELTTAQTSLMQVAYYGAYFVMAIPAGAIAKKFGYKGGVIAGLALFVIGSIITVPATNAASFALFLVSTFVVAAGATTLEANCNPYITKLGDEKHESTRPQPRPGRSTCVGSIVVPAHHGPDSEHDGRRMVGHGFAEAKTAFLGSTRGIYIVIAIVLAIMLAVFVFVKLPTPPNDVEEAGSEKAAKGGALKKPYFKLGVVAEFFYVGIQTVGFSLFATYATKVAGLEMSLATGLVSALSLLFTIGRFGSTPLLAKKDPGKLLGIYMTGAAVCFFLVFLNLGVVSVAAFVVAYLFMSIGYPTIFSLSLRGMSGDETKTGSSIITMSIVGGAIIPVVVSAIGDACGLSVAMLVAVPCLAFCAWYGFAGSKIGFGEE